MEQEEKVARPRACRTCHYSNSWFVGNLLTFSQCYALDLAARANSTFGREASQSLFEWYQKYCFFALFWAGPAFPSEIEVTYPMITVVLGDTILHMGLVTALTQPQTNTAIRLWGNRKFQLLCFFSPTSEYQNHMVLTWPCQTQLFKKSRLVHMRYTCNCSKIHADCSIWKNVWRGTSSGYHKEKYVKDKVMPRCYRADTRMSKIL